MGDQFRIAGVGYPRAPRIHHRDQRHIPLVARAGDSADAERPAEFLTLAERLRIKVTTTPYRFDQADQALVDLAGERVHGAAVLSMA